MEGEKLLEVTSSSSKTSSTFRFLPLLPTNGQHLFLFDSPNSTQDAFVHLLPLLRPPLRTPKLHPSILRPCRLRKGRTSLPRVPRALLLVSLPGRPHRRVCPVNAALLSTSELKIKSGNLLPFELTLFPLSDPHFLTFLPRNLLGSSGSPIISSASNEHSVEAYVTSSSSSPSQILGAQADILL